ncbi:MAG: hypothetical protein D3910_14330 [Candidatus Electrothrix sp. ATG2]|nr:hypothetical protein [Candidatus Electrothrix sp. ATG2]
MYTEAPALSKEAELHNKVPKLGTWERKGKHGEEIKMRYVIHMMLLAVIIVFCCIGCTFTPDNYPAPMNFQAEIHKPVKFISNIDQSKHYGTYLVHNVNYEPILRLKKKIEKIRGLQLTDRGEAHITLLTPPEHDRIKAFNSDYSMHKVEELVSSSLQFCDWEAIGVGSAKGMNFEGKETEVFFIVIESKELRDIRRRVAKAFELPKRIFDPQSQDFHITIGFVVSDLYNIPKDRSTLQDDLSFEEIF